jgi:hypothetical protein
MCCYCCILGTCKVNIWTTTQWFYNLLRGSRRRQTNARHLITNISLSAVHACMHACMYKCHTYTHVCKVLCSYGALCAGYPHFSSHGTALGGVYPPQHNKSYCCCGGGGSPPPGYCCCVGGGIPPPAIKGLLLLLRPLVTYIKGFIKAPGDIPHYAQLGAGVQPQM